jgi:hypothetical protein
VPVVFRHKGYRFFFFSNEGDPREPLHIHVRKGESVAKFWLEPEPAISEAYAMSAHELRELFSVAVKNKGLIERYWNEHFGV